VGVDILIPVNRLDRAKTRLAGLLTPGERRQLALLTLSVVLEAARPGGSVVVLSADDRSLLPLDGARFIEEDRHLVGLNAQLEAAIARMGPPDDLLILHADLPLATPEAIARLGGAPSPPAPLQTTRERGAKVGSVTAVRSADGGTNAMLLGPPGRFALGYGPGSFDKHMVAALGAGMAFSEHRNEALSLDLDSPADILALLAMPEARESPVTTYLRGLHLEAREGWPADA